MVVERAAKVYEKRTRVWPGGHSETVETRFVPLKPYSKERSVRGRPKKSSIPQDLWPQFEIVEAAILSGLGANFGDQTADSPPDLGGNDISQSALAMLNEKQVDDTKIVKEFMRVRATPEFRNDETAANMVMSALQSIRSVNSASNS